MDQGDLAQQRALFADVSVRAAPRPDGGLVLTNGLEPAAYPDSLIERLAHWAEVRPDQVFLGERDGAGWRTVTYGEAWAKVQDLAARLVDFRLTPERPLMLLAANSVLHAETMLAAMLIGAPVAPVSPAYAQPGREARLAEALALLTPGVLLFDYGGPVGEEVLRAALRSEQLLVACDLKTMAGMPAAARAHVEAAAATVGPDTIAKFLFTSGSTGAPKAVINTQRMLCSMQAALAQVWPFLTRKPPVMVDWLPWHHTFGGNHCFGIALYNGGALYIDDGKPLPGLVEGTIENLRSVGPSLHFNVPAGYEALLPHLEADPAAAREAFGRLDLMFNAAAALPQSTRDRLAKLTPAPVVGSWGATETAPEATMVYFDAPEADNIGAPMPGVEIKLAPTDGRLELRVRGPNVTPGYWRAPEATARAFDDEGFYRSGDAGRLLDPDRPERGLLFDGRLAENFKLSSGTWVNAGALRLAVLHAARPLVAEAVVCGHDRAEVGVLLFLDEHPGDREAALAAIAAGLAEHNRSQHGATTRVARFLVLDEPPSAEHGEVTAKGSINQAAVLDRRAEWVEQLYAGGHMVGP